jgi:hypothetical protein
LQIESRAQARKTRTHHDHIHALRHRQVEPRIRRAVERGSRVGTEPRFPTPARRPGRAHQGKADALASAGRDGHVSRGEHAKMPRRDARLVESTGFSGPRRC